ncbi:glycosyltransferase family 1 protein [Halonotius pteroides]|uniref:Glycosyltransferase family 1 protein n=1 Tax=Halonotius pteroides TaxID=268735 RepID=A0A3A6PWL2_9EURY|nr:glycosyltransferase family 1 protein [Halonotius pteroides]
MVTPRYPPVSSGGGEQSTKLLSTQLLTQERIDSVTVFAFDGTETTVQNDVTVQRLGRVSPFVTELQNLSVARKLRGRLAEFDVIHAYNMELHPVVGYLSTREGVPSVGTLNSYQFFPSSVTNTSADGLEWLYERIGLPTTGHLMRLSMMQMDAFIALSEAIRNIYTNNGFDADRIEHIPNMIDPDFSVPEGGVAEGIQLLYVGSLTENKGVRYLIEAVSLLSDQYRLRIVGDGDRMDDLRALAERCGVADRTTFSGQIPYEQVGQAYADADVFVHPGIWPEPLNRTMFEAMQAGLPVVCTDIGGPPEVIQDKELLCTPGDPEALAAAIKRVEKNSADIGERNKKQVFDNYAPSVVAPQIVDLYEQLLA